MRGGVLPSQRLSYPPTNTYSPKTNPLSLTRQCPPTLYDACAAMMLPMITWLVIIP
jgi:hypothetical protein